MHSAKPPLSFLLATLLVASACAQFTHLPELTKRDVKPPDLAQSTRIFDSDGRLITTWHDRENRTILKSLAQIPKHVQRAVIAIEDERYYDHDGVDVKAIIRAAWRNALAGGIEEGGSTITQQYVKNVIISPGETAEKTLQRKINEAALARQLEEELSKDEILLRYLNTVYFGEGAYGIQEAAKTYFGKPVWAISLEEGALLAGLIKSPELYNPFEREEAAKQRRDLVLEKMADLGWAHQTKIDKATRRKLRLLTPDKHKTYPAPYYVDYVQRLLTWHPRFDMLGNTATQRSNTLFTGGLRVYTSLDMDMQQAAEEAIPQVLSYESDPSGALVAIDPNNGHVKAMVGGRDYFATRKEDPHAKFNLAIAGEPELGKESRGGEVVRKAPGTGRQAGSAFKPFALAAAIEHGIPLDKTYKAAGKMTFPGLNNGGPWVVNNYEGQDFGSQLSLLEATVNSVNVVYAQVIIEVEPPAVTEIADAMGINTPLTPDYAAVLGSNPVNPLGMASAYATFASGGIYRPPVAITRIEQADGKVLYDYRDDEELEEQRVLDENVAYTVTTALQQVIERGTGTGAAIGRPAAGKTGTAQEYRDAWFGGYTPDLAAAVWVGYPEGEIEMKASCSGSTSACKPTRISVTGGQWPAPIWQLFMLQALSGISASSFPEPAGGTVDVMIDTRTGCKASKLTPDQYRAEATFLKGTQPKESCAVQEEGKKIPDVIGFPAGRAVDVLEGEGFDVQRRSEATSLYPPGVVVDQDPGGGDRAPRGSTVVIYVSVKDRGSGGGGGGGGDDEQTQDDTTEVPDVLGYSESEARSILRSYGFEVDTVIKRESNKQQAKQRRGRVWKQSPAGGSEAKSGSTVTIWVNP